jgi:hypothetical protein
LATSALYLNPHLHTHTHTYATTTGMEFLQANPDVKILIRGSERYAKKAHVISAGISMRKRVLELAGEIAAAAIAVV